MRRLLDVRIVRWELKLAYIVGVWVGGFALIRILTAIGAWGVFASILISAIDLAALLLGARIFRGKGEPIEPARPWWRMTAWRPLSRRLGILFAALAALIALYAVLAALGVRAVALPVYESVISGLFYGTLAYLYLNSAARLKRAGIQRPEPDVKFRPKTKLD